jgi:peptidoglycan/LPS O-acetylase OafA/YrhL
MRTARIDVIQYLRGIAALAVVFAHIASMQHSVAPELPVVLPTFNGFWGVDIFFVISGFIIVYITRNAAAGGKEAVIFMLKRMVRIVPAYWFFTVLIYFSDTQHWFSDQQNSTNLAMLLKSLFFIKPGFPILFVGWTLTLEMFFYLIFMIALWRWDAAVRMWSVVAVFVFLALVPVWFDAENRYVKFYTQAILLEFVAGMLIAYFFVDKERLSQSVAVAIFLVGCGLLLGCTYYLDDEALIPQRAFWWGIPALLVVLGAVNIKNIGNNQLLNAAGAISYSLYLCHMPCAYASVVLAKHFFAGSPNFLGGYVAIALTLTLLVSIASWRLLEYWPQLTLRRAIGGAV